MNVTLAKPPLFTGPAAAAYLLERVIERWREPRHQEFLQGWTRDYIKRHEEMLGTALPDYMRWLWELDVHLAHSPLYALEEEVSALVQSGAETLPDQPLLATDLPSQSGMLLFSHPIDVVDVHLKTYGVSGVLWTPANGKSEGSYHQGTMTIHFTTNDDFGYEVLAAVKDWFPPLSLLHVVFIPHGLLLSHEERIPPETAASHMRFIKTLQSFWAFVQQKVVDVEHRDMPRPIRKRAARAQRQVAELRVVKLRRVASSTVARSDEPHHVQWQARWVVRGHWRNQWYPKLNAHRAVWIYPFIKGPADMPLRVKRTVFDVRR